MSGNVANGPARRWPIGIDAGSTNARTGVAMGALVLLLTVSDAYGTGDLALLHRFSLWIVVCGLVAGQFLTIGRGFRAGSGRRHGMIRWGVAFTLTWALTTVEIEALKFTPLLPKARDPLPEFALFVLPLVAGVCALLMVSRARAFVGARPVPGPDDPRPISTASPLSPGARDADGWPLETVMAVHAQDHYLSVRTAERTLFIRGRMRDALERLPASEGLQVHRSWWVARSSVRRVLRRGRDYDVVLDNGERVPVARNRVPLLREAGWI